MGPSPLGVIGAPASRPASGVRNARLTLGLALNLALNLALSLALSLALGSATTACRVAPPSLLGFGTPCVLDADCVSGACEARLCVRGDGPGSRLDSGPPVDAGDIGGAWTWRVRVTIDNPTAEALVDVPVPVRLTDAELAPGSSLGAGRDFVVIDDAGARWDHDFERWQPGGEHLLWVRVPALPASGSVSIWLYYGDPAAPDTGASADVFRNDYVAVWHLGATPTGDVNDIPNALGASRATSSGMGADAAVEGAFGGALLFDGIDDALRATEHDTPTEQLTISLWMRPTATYDSGSPRADLLYPLGNGGRPHMTINKEGDGRIDLNINVDGVGYEDVETDNSIWEAGQLYFVAFTFDGNDWRAYVDGAPGGPQRGHPGSSQASSGLAIGSTSAPSRFFSGMIDEVRLSSVARSDAWMVFTEATARPGVVTLGQPQPL